MLIAGAVLAGCAPEPLQQRALARYTFLYGDAFIEWARRWRNQLKRENSTARAANAAKAELDRLVQVLDDAGGARDYLAAKRQSVAGMRADDIEATVRLWQAISPAKVNAIVEAALRTYGALEHQSPEDRSVTQFLALSAGERAAVGAALPSRDPAYWYLAADTAAGLRLFTLPAEQGGQLGRLIAQVNDVAEHLDTLLRIAPVVGNALPYDWLVRSAIVLELSTLLDLTLGPAPGHRRTVMFPLLDLCRQAGGNTAASFLEQLRSSIRSEGWGYLRWARNTLGAHVDKDLTLFQIHEHLFELDYPGVVRLAEHVLDSLDELGATQLEVKLLLLGERKIASWPTDPSLAAPGAPDPAAMSGSLARLFRAVDSPFMIGAGSSLGSAVVAGITAGRQPKPRAKVNVAARLDPLQLPRAPRTVEGWRS